MWLLGNARNESYLLSGKDKEILRRLRLNLFRIHAERESVKNVFRLITQGKIEIRRNTEPTERLQLYLDKITNILSKKTFDGLPQSAIVTTAYNAMDLVNDGERATLLTQLSDIRRNIFYKVEALTQPRVQEATIYNISSLGKVTVIHQPDRSETVNNQTLNITGSTVGDINQTAADSIQNSFNKTLQSEANDELKNLLTDLSKSVADLLKHIPKEQQEEVAKDLQVLTEEALSKAPRKKWYELSADGLIEAAKAIGEIATPVITTAKAVVAFLAGS